MNPSKRKHRKTISQTADRPLPVSLTSDIMRDLTVMLNENSQEFKFAYLAETYFSKYVGPETDPAEVRRSRAIEKWLSVELDNAETNHRLIFANPDEYVFDRVTHGQLMDRIRLIVAEVLYDSPTIETLFGTFSGGASTSHGRDKSSPALKFMDKADATRPAWDAILDLVLDCEPWAQHIIDTWVEPRFVEGNVMFTVPKTTIIDRVAAKEPDLNMFAQKGVGDTIRRRLKVKGIDLNDQSINGELARIGSIDGSLATLDLSSASDSVSTRLVFELLPYDWFALMDSIRSQKTEIDGEIHENHMFSSMGNGFTFELESLLFWAIARATAYLTGTRGRISVYGDDIIVPSSLATRVGIVLSHLGFKLNSSKSFWDGPFRESCGKHWYAGVDVTPFYIRQPIATQTRLIHFLNRLRAWAACGRVCDPRINEIWTKYSRLVLVDLWGGQDLDSITALVTNHPPRKQLVPVTVDVSRDHIGGYLYWLRTASTRVRITEPLVTSSEGRVTHIHRIRKSSQWVNYDLPCLCESADASSLGRDDASHPSLP